jgi:hypothetical protein
MAVRKISRGCIRTLIWLKECQRAKEHFLRWLHRVVQPQERPGGEAVAAGDVD